MSVYVASRLPALPDVLSCGAFAPEASDKRRVERRGRVRFDELGRPYLAYRGRRFPIVAGGALGANLPARIAESSGTVFYVGGAGASDANAGTSVSPWATTQHAVDTLASGQKALIRSGTYVGPKIYHKSNAATCTLEADTGAAVIFRGNGVGSNQCLDIWDSQNWRIRNIEIDGTLSQTCVSITGFVGDTNGYGRNIELYNVNAHDAQTPTNPSGIYAAGNGVTGVQIINSKSWRNGRRQLTTAGIVSGATTIPLDAVTNFPASGTVFLPDKTVATYTGITGTTLTGVTGVTSTFASGTVVFFAGNLGTGGATLDHGGYFHDDAGTNAPDILVLNSLFYDNVAFGMQLYPNAKNVWIVNTIAAYNFNQAGFTFSQTAANGVTGCKFVNCIAYANDPLGHNASGGFCWPFMTAGSSPINECRYSIAYLNKGLTTSAANFDAANAGVAVTANLVADPLFVDVAASPTHRDFHVQATSPAIGAADPAYCPSFDYDGNLR